MHRVRGSAILMSLAIIGITGFQFYWLKENYAREKKALEIKSEAAFRETVMELQVAKLDLGNTLPGENGSHDGAVKIFYKEDVESKIKGGYRPKDRIISTVNVIRDKLRDSMVSTEAIPPRLLIMNKNSSKTRGDSTLKFQRHFAGLGGKNNEIFNLLYGVDSLQDSLRVSEIDSAYKKKLKEEKIDIPFTITRLSENERSDVTAFNEVEVGFAHPVTFRFDQGNTFPYLFKKISLPILFSIILIGITIASFILLYRNMLKQQRLAALKNEFISNITHELKTPIATVGVAIEALKNFNAIQDPRRTREYLEISSNELQRLGFLVDKVLKLSMFEKKAVELQLETVNLREVVDEVVESLKLQFEKLQAEVDVQQKGTVELQADRLHLLSVVFNLLDNALKYSKANPRISIGLEEKEHSVEMRVKDNGIGIPAAYREKIFEKFFRVPQGNIHNARGYGLGLSYTAEVVRKHKGTIQVESEEGTGTAFIISLPKKPNG